MEKHVLKKIQITQLEMIKILDKICQEENIKYYLCAGTMLGGIRHQGFIPWDDDLDIMLPRKEYIKLLKVLKYKLPKEYWLQTYETDSNYWQAFAKIRKKNTVYKERGMENIPNEKCGIWIDIFPLDYAYKIGVFLKIRQFFVRIISFSFRRRIFKLNYSAFSRRYFPILVFLNFIPKNFLVQIQEKIMIRNNRKYAKKYYVNLASTYDIYKETYPVDWFEETERIQFEDTYLNVFKEYDKYLTQLYGNYMQLPPLEKRKGHNIADLSDIIV